MGGFLGRPQEMGVVKERFDITKSTEDKRLYRGLLLANGLKVVLVSDPTTDKSSASIGVGVGHMSDPWELPGIAHFCEHMLFLGTHKYPSENEYSKFIAEHGGADNACTFPDHTRYYFDIAPPHLKKALDILVQFFLGPEFTESATEREVNAVDSENKNNYKVDLRKVYQVEKSLSRPGHEYAKFGTGSKATLYDEAKAKGLNTREALLTFHSTFYSANIMTVCVLGQESLDELEQYVVELGFGDIENKNVVRPCWKEHPLGHEQLKQRIDVVPVQEIHKVLIRFPVPDDRKEYRTQAATLITHLLGHEGVGSLHAALKKRAWVTELCAGVDYAAPGFGTIQIEIVISQEGCKHVDDIIKLLFNYVGLLRRTGSLRMWWDELSQINQLTFTYKDKDRPLFYAPKLVHELMEYPIEDVLYAQQRCDLYDETRILKVLDKLRPDNLIYFVVSNGFDGKDYDKEKWYGTEYKRHPFTKEFMEMCETAMREENGDLVMPPPNEFIPSEFAIKTSEPQVTMPRLLHNDEWSRLWHLTDTSYQLPKCTAYMWISSPCSYRSPTDFAYLTVMVECFKDVMSSKVYGATMMRICYQLKQTAHGLELKVEGFDQKIPVFVNMLVTSLSSFSPGDDVFAVQKEQCIRKLRNFFMEQPWKQAIFFLKQILSERRWSKEQLQSAMNEVTLDGLKEYVSNFFSSFHIEALVHGNVDKQTSGSLVKGVVEEVKKQHPQCAPIDKIESLQFKEFQMPSDSTTMYRRTQKTHVNSTLLTYLQIGARSSRDSALLSLLNQIFQEPSFNILRTKEQLGYIVFCACRRASANQGLRMIVQGLKDPKFVIWRLENFIHFMRTEMAKLSDDELQSHKESVASKRLEKPKTLKLLTDKYWREVTERTYEFDRDEVEVSIMREVSKQELMEFHDRYIRHDGADRKVLHVLVRSELCDGPAECDIDQEMSCFCTTAGIPLRDLRARNCVQDLDEFKTHLTAFALDKNDIDTRLQSVH